MSSVFAPVTSSISPLTNYETSAINFARLVQRQVKQIGRSDPLTALQYIYLICLSADSPAPVGKEQVELCHDAIRELVMDSGSYAELLGDIKVDGSKIVRRTLLPPVTTLGLMLITVIVFLFSPVRLSATSSLHTSPMRRPTS